MPIVSRAPTRSNRAQQKTRKSPSQASCRSDKLLTRLNVRIRWVDGEDRQQGTGKDEAFSDSKCVLPFEKDECWNEPVSFRPRATSSTWDKIAEEEFIDNTESSVSRSAPIMIRFRSPAAWRLQLRCHSFSIWYPKEPIWDLDVSLGYLVKASPESPSLAVALDTSSLLVLGYEDNDARMLRAGQKLYCDALALLRREIAVDSAKTDDTILGTIHVLQVADMSTSMSMGDENWQVHARGVHNLLKTRSTKGIHIGYRRILDHNFRLFHFWYGVLARKRIDCDFESHGSALDRIAEQVPGALEECDDACADGPRLRAERAVELTSMLESLENSLGTWARSWYGSIKDSPRQLVPANKLPFADSDTSKSDCVFNFRYNFKDLPAALDYVLCTSCLTLIKQAMLKISTTLSFSQSTVNYALQEEGTKFIEHITKCADNLCMSVPYLCQPDNGKFGAINASGPLHLASSWYHSLREQEADRKLSWCQRAAKQIENTGIRPRAVDISDRD